MRSWLSVSRLGQSDAFLSPGCAPVSIVCGVSPIRRVFAARSRALILWGGPGRGQGTRPKSDRSISRSLCREHRMDDALTKRADRLLADAKRAGLAVAVAESCTGGLLCQVLSDAEGASAQFAGGFVTYTKGQKTAALGVPASLLKEKTA